MRFKVTNHANDPLQLALPLIRGANGVALSFNGLPEADKAVIWVPAPAARECVCEVLTGVGA